MYHQAFSLSNLDQKWPKGNGCHLNRMVLNWCLTVGTWDRRKEWHLSVRSNVMIFISDAREFFWNLFCWSGWVVLSIQTNWWRLESYLVGKTYYFTLSEVEPTWGKNEMNTRKLWKLGKIQNFSLVGNQVTCYHLVSHLGWQPLPEITKMTCIIHSQHSNLQQKLSTTKFGSIFK